MIERLKNSFAILMVAIFLLPTMVKLEHHHDHFVCKAKTEKHFHDHHEKCLVCIFEFSLFLSEDFSPLPEKQLSYGSYTNLFNTVHFSSEFDYSFLLRAPPVNCI